MSNKKDLTELEALILKTVAVDLHLKAAVKAFDKHLRVPLFDQMKKLLGKETVERVALDLVKAKIVPTMDKAVPDSDRIRRDFLGALKTGAITTQALMPLFEAGVIPVGNKEPIRTLLQSALGTPAASYMTPAKGIVLSAQLRLEDATSGGKKEVAKRLGSGIAAGIEKLAGTDIRRPTVESLTKIGKVTVG